ncbi:MAG: hydroxymethylglutaryl-CoA synthase [Candidatus Micrarchaeia archaeon]
MKLDVGIVGYGVYIPTYRIKVGEIARIWGEDAKGIESGLNVSEKSVPDTDEDCATMAVEAARNAVLSAGINPKDIGALYVGSESHPYAVKPTASIVAEAIGATPHITCADVEFACKAGTAAMQFCMGMCMAKMIKYGVAIGSDTSQGRPGDPLEYTAGAGAGAFIIGTEKIVARIQHTYSYTTDTPDFWRRPGAEFPSHGGRFTGEPAYFRHIINAAKGLFEIAGVKAADFDYAVFHQPNGKFPLRAAKMLGIEKEKVLPGLVTPRIGNTYSGATMIGLASVLDVAEPGERVLAVSFGSGAGSDAFDIVVTEEIKKIRGRCKTVREYIENKKYIDYGLYVKHRKKLKSL